MRFFAVLDGPTREEIKPMKSGIFFSPSMIVFLFLLISAAWNSKE